MKSIYFSHVYQIDNKDRKAKYLSLLLLSLQNDLDKWTQKIIARNDNSDIVVYFSPLYAADTVFKIYINDGVSFASVYHKTSPIQNQKVEEEFITDNYTGDLLKCFNKLRDTVFTPEILELQKQIGHQDRKGKLEHLELLQMKNFVEDTYQDWINSETELTAKLIAKIIYSYRNKEEIYNLWNDKFKDIELVIDELNKLKGL